MSEDRDLKYKRLGHHTHNIKILRSKIGELDNQRLILAKELDFEHQEIGILERQLRIYEGVKKDEF